MMAEPSMPDRRSSPGLSINLSSNNPFRNRAGSPAFPSPALSTGSNGNRPMSRNPFLSTFEAEFNKEASNPQLIDMSANLKDSPKKATFGSSADELFNNLSIDDKKKRDDSRHRAPPPPPSGTRSQGHRPSRSEEEERRLRNGSSSRGPPKPRGPPNQRPPHQSSPERRENRRPRRNSESSMIDKGSLDPDEERRRRERRKLRDERSKDERSKDPKSQSRSGKVRRPQGLDLIDKLDVTGIYGPSMIHHDGPYDAVQPHRNRRKDHRAPMQAFPAGSKNNILGGSGPVNKHIDLDTFHGRGAEGFTDFGAGTADFKKRPEMEGRSVSFNPTDRTVVHGEESVGLGTSTFLDGTPASRAAIQKREIESQQAFVDGGLGRKKSIAQRIRGISQPRRGFGDANPRITSPDARYSAGSPNSPHAISAGGIAKSTERNPFFDDYDEAYDKKGATIKVAESNNTSGPARSPSSPSGRNTLARAITSDSAQLPPPPAEQKPSGFLGRMKSLKGGRRPRPERPAA